MSELGLPFHLLDYGLNHERTELHCEEHERTHWATVVFSGSSIMGGIDLFHQGGGYKVGVEILGSRR